MAVPFILLGGAALAGITGAVKSVSAHTKKYKRKADRCGGTEYL